MSIIHSNKTSAAIKTILSLHGGTFVTLNATKKDGSPITLNGKIVPPPASHKNHENLLTIKKSRSGSYRTIDLHNISRLAIGGNVISFK